MVPVRPGGMADSHTERIPTAPSVEYQQLAAEARARGLVWLRDEHLSDPHHPDHLTTLLAVMNLDLDRGGSVSGRLTEYRRVFAALRTTPEGKRAVAQLLDEYERRGVCVTPRPGSVRRLSLDAVTETTPPPDAIPIPASVLAATPAVTNSGLSDVPELSPEVAAALGFTELVKLGQGGFGTVYAARQPAVGNRVVAIKYTAARSRESQVLAALQHPNIMPVWSVHENAGHRVFCMPLHGRATIADLLRMIDRTKSLPATGAGFLSAASVTEVEKSVVLPLPAEQPTSELVLAEDAPEYESDRRRLEKQGYVDSVVQGMTRLADALAHAHRRKVVHLDIKPANILITDDGGFMILDFGLAYQNGLPASPEAGGTVRYMAPEQLVTFVAGKGVRPDPRMDLYALGIVFFELLTGRHPFAESLVPGSRRDDWVNARHSHPPRVRRFNPAVPPGVEAVVLKLLHPERGERYQTAEQVFTDLTRHRNNESLIHTANPSAWERFLKFRRRHPVFSVACMAVFMAMLALGGYWVAHLQHERAEASIVAQQTAAANEQLAALLPDLTPVRIDAGSLQSAVARRQAIAVADRWYAAYQLDSNGWRDCPHFARLAVSDQQQVNAILGEMALLAAHAERLNALGRTTAEAMPILARATEWNHRAESIFGTNPPAAVGEQRAALSSLLGRSLPALPPPPPDQPIDLYLRALGRIADGDHRAATATLEELERRDPQHAAGQFALGFVYQSAGRFNDAATRYEVAKALAPHDARAAFNRGAMFISNRHPDEAVGDLTTAIDRDPKMEDAYHLRATGRYQIAVQLLTQKKLDGLEARFAHALADIDTAIQLGGRRYRHVSLRAAILRQIGDTPVADAELRALDTIAPADDQDYIARAFNSRRQGHHDDALADFAQATKRNPLNPTAWHSLAAQAAALGRMSDAADAYERVIALVPDLTAAKFKRAVLLARLGESEAAVKLIDGLAPPDTECLLIQASVYALTSRYNLNDRKPAYYALLAAARANAVNWEAYDRDKDFDEIRELPEFAQLKRLKGRPVE